MSDNESRSPAPRRAKRDITDTIICVLAAVAFGVLATMSLTHGDTLGYIFAAFSAVFLLQGAQHFSLNRLLKRIYGVSWIVLLALGIVIFIISLKSQDSMLF